MTINLSKSKPQKVIATALLLYGSMGLQAHALTVGTANGLSNRQTSGMPAGSPTTLSTTERHPAIVANLQTGKQVRVKGHVGDANGEPIVGATVTQRGTKNAAITDIDGNFTIEVPAQSELTVSYIGFADQTVKAAQDVNIVMKANEESLDEVVVVGYGVQKKVNLTGAVSAVKGDELQMRPITDASQGLQGMVPGLLVTNNKAGRPGATGTLSLRGQGNLSGTGHPYVLVDGIEMSLSDVNPNDIESISVLKDAAACAIYGARAAYGVILVTTKKGAEGKLHVSYQGSVGWSSPTVLPKMANALEFAHFWNDGVTNAGSSRLYSAEKLEKLRQYMENPESVNPWYELPANANMNPAFENSESGVGNVDYFKLHYKNSAFKQQHNLSFSGGTKAAQYYISGGYLEEDGILRYADINYKRMNVASTISSQITPWMKMKFGLKFRHSLNKTPFGSGAIADGFFHSLARFRPTVSVVDPNGHFTELSMIPYLQSGTYTRTKQDLMNLSGGLEFNPFKGFNIYLDYTYKLSNWSYQAKSVAPLIYGADGVSTTKGVRSELGISAQGGFTRAESHTRYQNISLYGNYTFS